MRKAILKTIIYADIFKFPLKKEEIWQRLIWNNPKKPTRLFFEKSLDGLINDKLVQKADNFYFLPGNKDLIIRRKKAKIETETKIVLAKKVAKILSFLPLVKLVGLTGSVAAENAKAKDDIDFLVISSSGWLWTTRFLTTAFVNLLGLRRHPGREEVKNKICLNLFIDEGKKNIFAKDKNLFFAYEILQLKPLYQRKNAYWQFLKENLWIKEFLPNAFRAIDKNGQLEKPTIEFWLKRVIENSLKQFQLWLMRKRKTNEVTTSNLIAFHPKSIRQETLNKFNKKLTALDKSYFS